MLKLSPLISRYILNEVSLKLYYLFVHQASAQLLSAGMIIQAHMAHASLETSVLMRPWFIILVLAGAVERLSGLALGVAVERDWVVLVFTKLRIL